MSEILLKTLEFPGSDDIYRVPSTPGDIGAAPSMHDHSASQITSGTLSVARGGTGVASEEAIGLKAYPVGSIYLSVNSTSPASLFGGTWERIKDKFLLSAGDSYVAGSTGGEATHTLTVAEIPSHKHISFGALDAALPDNYGGSSADYGICAGDEPNRISGYDKSTGASGGGQPHNNMPPYLAVYVWKRTA
jgi:hypothetical protein